MIYDNIDMNITPELKFITLFLSNMKEPSERKANNLILNAEKLTKKTVDGPAYNIRSVKKTQEYDIKSVVTTANQVAFLYMKKN